MGGDFKDVGGPVAGLLANLSMCNATVDFESLQELLRSLPNLELSHLKRTAQEFSRGLRHFQMWKCKGFESYVANIAPLLNMNCDQVKDLYNDFQTTLYGIAKIEATSSLGLRVCLTMKNVHIFACK